MSRKASSFLVGIIAGAAATLMLPRIMKKLQEALDDETLPSPKPARSKPARQPVKRKIIAKSDKTQTKSKKTKSQA